MAYNTKAVEEYRKLKKEAEERSKTRALQKEATSLNSELNAWLDESAALNNRYNTWYKEDGLSKSDEENETAYSQAMQSRLNLIRQATELKNRLWQNEDYYGKDTVDKLTEQIDSRIHGSTDMMDAWADNRMNLDDYRQVKEAADEAGIEIADPYVFYMNKHYGEESIDLTYPEYARQMTQLAPRLGEAQRQFESEFTPVTQQDVDDAQAALDRAQALFDEAGDPYAYLKDTNGKNMVGENGRFITVSENLQNARNTLNNTKHQFEEYTEKSKWSDGQKMDYVFGKRSAFTQQNEQYLKESNLSGEQQVGYLINQGYSWEEIETIAMDMNAHDVVDSDQLLLDYVNRVNASDAKAEMLNDLFDGNPLVDTAVSGLSLLTSLAGGVIAFGEDTVNQLQGDELDVGNSFGHFLLDLGDSSRQAVAMDIGDDHPIAQWLYMNGMSFLDSAAAVGIGTATGMPSLTLGIMGTGSAARTIAQGKERGLSDDQAYASGFMSGLAEVVFENVSLENLGSLKKFMDSPTRTVKGTIKKYLARDGIEGSEEFFTDIANLLSDQIINGDRSELMSNIAAYEAQGMSEGQAIQNALKDLAGQLGSDFLGGFLSGGLMAGGVHTIYTVNNLMTGNTARSVGRMLNMSGDAASVANFALDNINQDSADYRAAQSLLQTAQEGGELSASQTGKVLKAGIKAYRDNVSGRIAAVLENDMPSTQAKAMANKLLSGEELSAGETGVVLNDAVVRSVVEQALGVTVDTTAGAQSMRTALSDAAGNAFSLKNLLEPYTVAKNAAPVSNEAQTVQGDTAGPFLQGQPAVIHATGQEVTVTGIGRTDGNGSVQMSLSDGTQMDLADLGFENPAVKELVVVASEYPTAAARAFTSGYDGSTPLSLYHSGFDYLYQQAINGMPLGQAVATSGEIGQMLSPQVQYLAYTAGRNVAEGTFEDTYASSFVEQNGLPNLGNDDMIKNATKDEAQPEQDGGGDGDGPSEEDLENSRKNIREFVNGRKKFTEVIDDYAKVYERLVKSNEVWQWNRDVIGGDILTKRQKRQIKRHAEEKGYIIKVNIIKKGLKLRFGIADFKGAGLVKETLYLPEDMWNISDVKQFKWLDDQIGGPVEGYTWHHTENPGEMELVPFGYHNITTHNGGRTKGFWAFGKR